MEAFLQILQRTMKILAMPGRLSAMLKANIRIWAMISVSKQQKKEIYEEIGLKNFCKQRFSQSKPPK